MEFYPALRLCVEVVIDILAKLEKIDHVNDMTVILCVDGLQKFSNNGTKDCAFYRILASICSFLNASTAFAVCVCAATIQSPVRQALSDSPQKRVLLLPPPLHGDEILVPRTRLEKQLVDDMGGHGRALESLEEVFLRYKHGKLEKVDLVTIVEQVCSALGGKYGDVFDSPLFNSRANCQDVLAAILSQRSYGVSESIGRTGHTVDELRSFGLFRLTEQGHLECAFILVLMLIRKHPNKGGDAVTFDKHLTRSVMVWQQFEHFVAFYRGVKSIVYCDGPVALSTFHAGARFGPIDQICIRERSPRKVVESSSQLVTKCVLNDLTCFTNCGKVVKVSDMNTIIINGASAPAGDILMGVQLMIGDKEVRCNEVIQCKLVQTKKKITKERYDKEVAKAANVNSDVFLLITTAQVTDQFVLPARCGIVSKDEFRQYFGPFASRAYRSLLDPPNINTASFHELRLIRGLGEAIAKNILAERKRKRFSSFEDAVVRLNTKKRSKTVEVLRALHFDDAIEEADF